MHMLLTFNNLFLTSVVQQFCYALFYYRLLTFYTCLSFWPAVPSWRCQWSLPPPLNSSFSVVHGCDRYPSRRKADISTVFFLQQNWKSLLVYLVFSKLKTLLGTMFWESAIFFLFFFILHKKGNELLNLNIPHQRVSYLLCSFSSHDLGGVI